MKIDGRINDIIDEPIVTEGEKLAMQTFVPFSFFAPISLFPSPYWLYTVRIN